MRCPMNIHDLAGLHPKRKFAPCFRAGLESALARVMAEFKRRAEAATTPAEMWETESYLRQRGGRSTRRSTIAIRSFRLSLPA